jgi:hypothetical protein
VLANRSRMPGHAIQTKEHEHCIPDMPTLLVVIKCDVFADGRRRRGGFDTDLIRIGPRET